MDLDEKFLRSLIGGVLYYRLPSIEGGPDWYYLFRSRITDVWCFVNTFTIFREHLFPNRWKENDWHNHEYPPFNLHILKKEVIEIKEGNILYIVHLNEAVQDTAEIVIYPDERLCPELNPHEHFPAGFEFFHPKINPDLWKKYSRK